MSHRQQSLQNINQVLQLFLRNNLLEKRQLKSDERLGERQEAGREDQLFGDLAKAPDLDIDRIEALFGDRNIGGLRDVAAKQDRRQIGSEIQGAETLESVPTTGGIQRRAMESGQGRVDLPFQFQGEETPSGLMVDRQEIQQLIAEGGLQRESLRAAEPRRSVKNIDATSNVEFERFLTDREIAERGAFGQPTGRTAGQQGEFELGVLSSGVGSPEGQAITARGAAATTRANLLEGLKPDVAQGEIDVAGATAEAQEIGTTRGRKQWVLRDGQPTFAVPQAGDQQAPPITDLLSAGQQSEIALLDTVSAIGQEVLDLGEKTDWSGIGGFFAGSRGQFAAGQLGEGTADEQALRSKIGNLRATIVALRAGAAFTPTEEALIDTYVATINEEPLVIKAKIAALQQFIVQKKSDLLAAAELGRGLTPSGAGTVGDGNVIPGGTSVTIVPMHAPDGRSLNVPSAEVERMKSLGATVD